MEEYLSADETYKIIGILFEVHKNLGKGFAEIVYKDALEFEFKENNIPFEREKEYTVQYKNTVLNHKFYADFVLYGSIILEIKTVDCFNNSHYNQCLNYFTSLFCFPVYQCCVQNQFLLKTLILKK